MTFPRFTNLSRPQALLLVALIWAAIYLPALGSLEIKGEEGRRLLPAVAMLETGRWIVPQVGGVPYLSKPPLINWLAAGAFRLAGSRSEWAARAPSVLAVLALALAAVGALSAWLTSAGAGLTAVFLLTNIGLMEKGRLAEIEALYLSLYGIALVLWLGAWRREASMPGARPTWRAWTLPWVFLGLGLLTKGPLHLVFFYAVVIAILLCAGRMRDLWNGPHLAGVVLMLAIFGAWSVPYLRQVAAHHAGDVWLAQFQNRLEVNEGFHFGTWVLNVPRGLANFLPWTVLLPLWWHRAAVERLGEGLDHAILRGGRWAVTACFLAVSLAPGGQPRYTMPLLVPACVLLALGLVRSDGWPAWLPVVWKRVVTVCFVLAIIGVPAAVYAAGKATWLAPATLALAFGAGYLTRRLYLWPSPVPVPVLGLASAAVMALITADYAIGAVPRFRRAEAMRPMAAQIEATVPPGEGIAVLRPGFLPYLYYLRPELLYIQRIGDLPAAMRYLLVRQDDLASTDATLRERHADYQIALRVRDKRLKDDPRSRWLLLRLDPPPEPRL